jgi:hypothetical protein
MNLPNDAHNCAVCLEELTIPCTNSCITDCAHVFHLKCLLKNRQHNTRCPVCRKDISIGERPVSQNRTADNTQNYYLKIYVFILVVYILYQAYNNVVLDRNTILEEMLIENKLNHDIKDILSSVARIEIPKIDPIAHQIRDACIHFGNSSLHYIRNVLKYDINYLPFDKNQLHSKIFQIVNDAVHHNITFAHFETNIRNCCFDYIESKLLTSSTS